MHLSSIATTFVFAFSGLILSVPVDVGIAGSKHNFYLATCSPSCLLLCDPDDTITAAIYFENGPITEGSSRVSPTSVGRVTGRNTAWEGSSKSVRIGSAGTLKTNIASDAKSATKGSLVGDASLATEPFVCFKDGTTKFTMTYDFDRYECTTEYWCPSISVEG